MRSRSHKPRRGFSLLELVAAAALIAGTLVPALAVIRDAMAESRSLHRRGLLANYAVSILEERAAIAAIDWTNATVTGDFASDGHPNLRYIATASDLSANGGLVGQLMHVGVTVYDDTNSNSTPDSQELQETYRTKVAKLNTYENEEQ